MEISFGHGFACSAPKFGVPDQLSMTFLISTIIPTKRSFRKYLEKMCDCMDDIYEFAYYFSKQLDFSCIDISMFKDVKMDGIYFESLVILRDQLYNELWEDFLEDVTNAGRTEDADIIKRCIEFEIANKKDIGLVYSKLDFIIQNLDTLIARPESN
jgi:hypothetical protein